MTGVGMNGLILFGLNTRILTFFPDGNYSDIDPEDFGEGIDCSRTSPSGRRVCLHYEVRGSQIRMEEDFGEWGEWLPLAKKGRNLQIDEQDHFRLAPMTGLRVDAFYSSDGARYNGALNTGISTNFEEGYALSRDGRFAWRSSSTSTVMISPDPFLGGAVGGGSSSRSDGGTGTYAVEGNWMTLTFDDGRTIRVFVHADDKGWRRGQPAPDTITFNGDTLYLPGKAENEADE